MPISDTERRRLLARMFTRPVFATLAATGDWRRALSFLLKNRLLQEGRSRSVAQLFEVAWEELRRDYRNEYVYKAELANRLVFGRHSPRTAGLHIEMPVGRSIVDVAVFNGTSTAYEIKTEFDSARRLDTQTADYLKVFDQVFVVAHPSAAIAYADVVPAPVGVLALETKGSLKLIKRPASNLATVSSSAIFRCLRRDEYLTAIESATNCALSLPNGLIAKTCYELFSDFSPEMAHRIFVDALRRRQTSPKTVEFVIQLPSCLRALGYATPLSGRQKMTAVKALDTSIKFAIA